VTDTTPTAITKPEDLRPYKVDAEAFWQIERMAGGDGYDVMDVAQKHEWLAVSGWGRDGWDFLEWPYYVGYVRNTPEGFEFATNCEGDIDVWRFPSRELRERAMDLWAFLNWERKNETWVAGVSADAIPDHLRGSFSWSRVNLDNA
jgi:hypothetical protein